MTAKKRPRGRGPVLAATLLLALGLDAGGAQAQMQAWDPGLEPSRLVPATDGATWVEGYGEYRFSRIAPDGRVTRFASDPQVQLGPGAPLLDGSLGIVALPRQDDRRWMVVCLGDDGSRATRRLPVEASLLTRPSLWPVLEPDGSAWIADSCRDRLARVSPSGRLQRFRLRAVGCPHVDEWVDPVDAQVLLRGVDGGMWLVNHCQGRVVRIDRDDRVREWRVRSHCSEDRDVRVLPSRALVEPAGGLRLAGQRITRRGAIRPAPASMPDVVTADGAEWTLSADGDVLELRRRDGTRQRFVVREATGRPYAVELLAGPDGRAWIVAGEGRRGERIWLPGSATVATISAAGETTLAPLPAWPSGIVPRLARPGAVVGSDGAVWTHESGVDDRPGGGLRLGRVTRIAPQPPVDATTQARVVRVLERRRGRLWVQVACDAAPGRWCTGSARLADRRGRSLLRRAPRFAVPAGAREAVLLPLAKRTRAALRRGAIRAAVRLGDAAATAQTIRVPR